METSVEIEMTDVLLGVFTGFSRYEFEEKLIMVVIANHVGVIEFEDLRGGGDYFFAALL